jgi:molecular chaperone GrpE
LFAEFENYKDARNVLSCSKQQEVLLAMLLLDDFDRAEIAKSEDEVMAKGVELIHEN